MAHFLPRFGLAVLISIVASAAAAQNVPQLWKLVAQSDMIVVGVADPPVERIREAPVSGRWDYVRIPILISECLKPARCGPSIDLDYFPETKPYSPTPDHVVSSKGRPSIFFLVQRGDLDHGNSYFAGYTREALQPYSAALAEQVKKEVARQERILSAYSRAPQRQDPVYRKVKLLIEESLQRETQTHALAELEALGDQAVPAIILLMDDRRELPIHAISLGNKAKDAFEGYRHYTPQLIVDALAAILNQITGESFDSIQNGATERERRAAVDGWRIYLAHRSHGTR